MLVKSENDGSGQRNAVPWPPLTRGLDFCEAKRLRERTIQIPAFSPPVTFGDSPLVRGGQGRFAPQADAPHPAVNIRGCSDRRGGMWASRPTKSQGVRCAGRCGHRPLRNHKGCGESVPVLSGIQNVITDGNPAKWMGGVSKKGRGQRGFVKITRGKSDGLIRF